MSKLNQKYITAMIAIVWVFAFCDQDTFAAAIQKSRQVGSYEMFMPADTSVGQVSSHNQPVIPRSKPLPSQSTEEKNDEIIGSAKVNYNLEIAKAWFPPLQEDVVIGVDSYPKRILVTEGRNLLIKLTEYDNQIWSFDHESELRLISKTKEDNELLLVFNAIEGGTTTLYLDLVEINRGVYKVIESRAIYVIVG